MKEKMCFVIMPFSSSKSTTKRQWDNIYKNLFKPAIEEAGYGLKCKRNKIKSGAFIKHILDDLSSAFIVLADLTDLNANVFYELGVRHTLANKTIMVTQDIESVPSDLKPYGVIEYSKKKGKKEEFEVKIKDWIDDFVTQPDRSDNPVWDFLKVKDKVVYEYERKMILQKIAALMTETSWNVSELKRLEDNINKKWTKRMFSEVLAIVHFRITCLELLLTTQYLILDNEFHIEANRILNSLKTIEKLHSIAINKNDMTSFRRVGKKIIPSTIELYELFAKKIGSYFHSIKSDETEITQTSYVLLYSEEHEKLFKK